MTYQKIDFVSRQEAEGTDGSSSTIVISISEPNMPAPRLSPDFRAVLPLQFHNVEHLSGHLVRFTRFQAEQILAFVEEHEGTATEILVHCGKGESRSAGVAKFLAEKYQLPLTRSTDEMNKWVYHVFNRLTKMRQFAPS